MTTKKTKRKTPGRSKRSATLWLDEYLPYRLGVAASDVAKVISPYYHLFGLSISEVAVLAVLSEVKATTQQSIVAKTAMEKFAVSRAAKALIASGLVERLDHETDGRSHWLSLTPAGTRLYARVAPMSLAYEAKLRDALGGQKELDDAKNMLSRLQHAAGIVGPTSRELFAPYVKASEKK